MQRRIRLGFVDASHLHLGGLVRAALECPEIEVVGLSEADDELRGHHAQQFSGLATYASAEELYEAGHPEAIVTCADNRAAVDIVAEAARRGVHVMKEKPMAATLELADRMSTTAVRAGIRLMINWPTNWQPAIHHAKRLVDEGRIGRVWQVHNRAGHGGPPAGFAQGGPVGRVGWGWLIEREQNGGGALVDFCSYGAAISRWFMGQPNRVSGAGGRYAKQFFTVEDNAILILRYQQGHSVCEGTWTQPASPVRVPLMIYGTEGAIAVTGPAELTVARQDKPREPEVVTAPALPDHYRSGPAYFAHQLISGEPFAGLVSIEVSRDSQEILEAGRMSMASGCEVALPLGSFL